MSSPATLPAYLDAATEATMADDRQWFADHPTERVRRRPPQPGEHRANQFAFLAQGDQSPLEPREVIVVCAPGIRTIRLRLFLSGDLASDWSQLGYARALAQAATDDEFWGLLPR